MSYYVVYNPSLGNAIVGISESFDQVPEGLIVAPFEGDIPNLTEWYWHPGSISFLKYPDQVALTKLAFLRKFTQAARVQIREAANVDPLIEDFMRLLDIAEFVDLKDSDTLNALNYFVYKSILTSNRLMEILE